MSDYNVLNAHMNTLLDIKWIDGLGLGIGLWCLMTLSTMFELHRDG